MSECSECEELCNISGHMTITSPLRAGQETVGCELFQSLMREASRIPEVCEPGMNLMAPLSVGQSSTCTRKATMRARTVAGGCTCTMPPLVDQGPKPGASARRATGMVTIAFKRYGLVPLALRA